MRGNLLSMIGNHVLEESAVKHFAVNLGLLADASCAQVRKLPPMSAGSATASETGGDFNLPQLPQLYSFAVHRMKKPVSIEVIDEGEQRFVVLTYPDGEIERQLVDPTLKAKRKPRKPIARVGLWKGRKKGV